MYSQVGLSQKFMNTKVTVDFKTDLLSRMYNKLEDV